jgi:HK97 family phage major capsid protein
MSTLQKKMPAEATIVNVTWEDEAGEIDEQNPTYGLVTLTAKKLAGLTTGIPSELLADSEYDIVGSLVEQFMYAIGLEMDNQVLNGTGSPCSGVLSAACGNSVIMANGLTNFSSITADHLSEMINALSEEDAAQSMFVYNRLIQHYIRTAKDTNGQYIWQKPAEGRPGTIWETPYVQSTKAPGTSAANTAFVALGNWKQFYIGRRAEMAFAADPFTNFSKDQVRFRAITRAALNFARASAFVRLLTKDA